MRPVLGRVIVIPPGTTCRMYRTRGTFSFEIFYAEGLRKLLSRHFGKSLSAPAAPNAAAAVRFIGTTGFERPTND